MVHNYNVFKNNFNININEFKKKEVGYEDERDGSIKTDLGWIGQF